MPHRRAPLNRISHNPEDEFIPWLKETFLNKGYENPRQGALNYQFWSPKQREIIIRTLPESERKEVPIEIPETVSVIKKPNQILLKRRHVRIFRAKNNRILITRRGRFIRQKGFENYVEFLKSQR